MRNSPQLPPIGTSLSVGSPLQSPVDGVSKQKRVFVRQRSHSFDNKDMLEKTIDIQLEVPVSDPLIPPTSIEKKSSTRRVLGRGESKDDIYLPPSSAQSTSSSLPALSAATSPYSKDDSHSHHKSAATSVLSNTNWSFIRVYCGLKTFYPRNETVVVAIFFQPNALVYEVIILDILDREMIGRMYIHQSELVLQLRKRRATLELKKIQLKKEVTLKESLFSNMFPTSLTDVIRSESSKKRAEKLKTHRRRHSDNNHHTQGEQLGKVHGGDSSDMVLQQDPGDDIDLDTIDVHGFVSKPLQNAVFPKVILKCLRSTIVTGKASTKYRLINDDTQSLFVTFASLPEELKTLAPTVFDPAALISQARSLSSLRGVTSSLRRYVDVADTCANNLRNDMEAFGESQEGVKRYLHEAKRNPNVMKWRLMWQFAIRSVIKRNRASRKIRTTWNWLIYEIIAAKKEKDEVEQEFLSRRGVGGGFLRPLRARRKGISVEGGEEGRMPMSSHEMAQYKTDMVARRQLRKDKTARLLNMT